MTFLSTSTPWCILLRSKTKEMSYRVIHHLGTRSLLSGQHPTTVPGLRVALQKTSFITVGFFFPLGLIHNLYNGLPTLSEKLSTCPNVLLVFHRAGVVLNQCQAFMTKSFSVSIPASLQDWMNSLHNIGVHLYRLVGREKCQSILDFLQNWRGMKEICPPIKDLYLLPPPEFFVIIDLPSWLPSLKI